MPVTRFHDVIEAATRDAGSPREAVCSLLGVVPEQPLSAAEWDTLQAGFSASFSDDLPPALALRVAGAILDHLTRPEPPRTYGDLIDRTQRAYEAVAQRWSRLLAAFVRSTLATCAQSGVGEIVFLARDATPLFVMAQRLRARVDGGVRLTLLDLNRNMVRSCLQAGGGGRDVDFLLGNLSAREWQETPLGVYLTSRLFRRGPVALVETGLYGTLVKMMIDAGILANPSVLFFVSSNPHIFGYLNVLLSRMPEDGGVPHEFAVRCCDMLEIWPKLYTSGELGMIDGAPTVVARAADAISVSASLALYQTLARECDRLDIVNIDPSEELRRFHRLSEDSASRTGQLSLVLSEPIPTWRHAGAWRAAWDLGRLPPMDAVERDG